MVKSRFKTIAVAAYDGLLGYEFGIVAELFGLVRPGFEDTWYDFKVCRVEKGELTTSHGLRIQPDYRLRDLMTADIVIVPGWRTPDQPPKPAFLNALRTAYKNRARIISVCTGAFALGYAGILAGKSVTTHWLYVDRFRELFPDVHVEANRLYIHDGLISTSAGSSAGLDLCLSVIREDWGVEVANLVAKRMVAPLHREGGQSQYSSPEVIATEDAEIGPILDWISEHFAEEISIPELAKQSSMSLRTFHRRFQNVTGKSPGVWLNELRIAKARGFLEVTGMTVEQIAAQCGLGNSANFRKHFMRVMETTPGTYRSNFRDAAVASSGDAPRDD